MKTRVMIDIETMGLPPKAAICSVGIASSCGMRLYSVVDWERGGGEITPSTVKWWMEQDALAQAEILDSEGVAISEFDCCEAIINFFATLPRDVEVWANSPSFDCQNIKSMFERNGFDLPWEFWQENDFRTIRNLMPRYERPDVSHNALDDAKSQLAQLQAMLGRIKVK